MRFRPVKAHLTTSLLRAVKPLQSLFSEVQRIEHLQGHLLPLLPSAAHEHCHVASYRDGRLLIVVSNSHWATRIRYLERRLLRALLTHPEFAQLSRIFVRVQPEAPTSVLTRPAPQLSESAAEQLNEAAKGIRDPALRGALERLARNANKKPALGDTSD